VAAWAFTWDAQDAASRRWWPQGITSSGDATAAPDGAGRDARPVLLTSAYSRVVDGVSHGSRVTVVDLADPGRIRYRHVLLVRPVRDAEGRVDLRPVAVHAGGLAWHGPWLYVAGTGRGISVFALDDVLAVGGTEQPGLLGRLPDGGLSGHGHRYVLPVRFDLTPVPAEGQPGFRYSFLSLARDEGRLRLLAGEYGVGDLTRRLAGYDLDPARSLPAEEADGSVAASLSHDGVERMQGAVLVDGRLHVTTSRGRFRRGNLWVGPPGRLHRHRAVLPIGPEDIAYWPERDQLWSLSEYPRRRVVVAIDRSRFD
jgi:hypothetical protein